MNINTKHRSKTDFRWCISTIDSSSDDAQPLTYSCYMILNIVLHQKFQFELTRIDPQNLKRLTLKFSHKSTIYWLEMVILVVLIY